MPINTRPTDTVTPENFYLGMPVVEFAPLVGGVQQPFINLGIVDNAELAKELDKIALEDGAPGVRSTILEIITRVDPEFNVGVFNFAPEVLRYVLGGAALTTVTADSVAAVTNELVTTTLDPEDYLDLANRDLNAASLVVTCATVTDEAVGTGDGAAGSGAVSGDFSLDFKVQLIADVSGTIDVLNAGVITTFAVIEVGAAASGNEVEVARGKGATSGNLQFFTGAASATNVTGDITATYTPSFTLEEGLAGGVLTAVDEAASDDGTVFTDETTDANSAAAADVVLSPAVPVTNDAFYVGMHERFDRIVFNISTGAAASGTIVWEYSQGGASWAALANVSDDTNGFETTGTNDVVFDVPADWAQEDVNSQGLAFHVRARVGTAPASGATGTQIWTSNSKDYVGDLKNGRLQVHTDASKTAGVSRPVIATQPMHVDYTYDRLDHTSFQPFTQNVFDGVGRIRHISDVGGNMIFDIPSAQIQVTGDALAWDDENFMVASVTMKILDAGSLGGRFGTMQTFSKTQAGN